MIKFFHNLLLTIVLITEIRSDIEEMKDGIIKIQIRLGILEGQELSRGEAEEKQEGKKEFKF